MQVHVFFRELFFTAKIAVAFGDAQGNIVRIIHANSSVAALFF